MKDKILILLALHGAMLLAFLYRWPLVDDAYITFRYADNLINGNGLVYNTGESILGVTTPLWTVVLAGLKLLGIPFETSVNLINITAIFGIFLVTKEYFLSHLKSFSSLILILLLLFFHILVTLFSGMETCTYLFCVIASIKLAIKDRGYFSLFLAALATLLRPDGIIVCLVSSATLWVKRKTLPIKEVIFYGIMLAPWLVYAHLTYGSFIPQSIPAKKILHPILPLDNLLFLSEAFTQNLFDFLSVIIFGAGFILLCRDRRFLPWLAWLTLYIGGIIFSGIKSLFYWYYTPIWIFLIIFGSLGLLKLGKEKKLPLLIPTTLLVLVLVISSLYRISKPDATMERYQLYREIVSDFVELVPKKETIYVCETGILGYGFKENRILDASGINSLEAYHYRSLARKNMTEKGIRFHNMSRNTDWGIQLVKNEKPNWIISPRGWCQLVLLEKESWFQKQYQLIREYPLPELSGLAVYKLSS